MNMPPMTFDAIPDSLRALVSEHRDRLGDLEWIAAIRDLWSRVRFVVPKRPDEDSDLGRALTAFAEEASQRLDRHGYPTGQAILYADEMAIDFNPEQFPGITLDWDEPRLFLIDRQVSGLSWGTVNRDPDDTSPDFVPPRRIAFYSIKGGVGRSTSAAVAAWHLAREGKNVLVVDLDLEAPGLSSSLFPPANQPPFGIVDWFVEDAVGQGDTVLPDISARSPLATNLPGYIRVVPCHGANPTQYLPKLGRCYLDLQRDGKLESWERRLGRFIEALEAVHKPDLVLLDARAGLSDLASAVVTDLQAEVFLFAIGTTQTWSAYRLLFEEWRGTRAILDLREQLHLVAALVPETDRESYLTQFRQEAWDLFRDHAYDNVEPDAPADADLFTFDLDAVDGPHSPIPVYWNRGIAALSNLSELDPQLVAASYSTFLSSLDRCVEAMLGASK
ncbi:MAG: AAA family ATPase [Deltaproteobacteria bacterium]|nr:AAA family ATPase [Deltaproteobacteria bacterium]